MQAFEWEWLGDAFAIVALNDAVLARAGRLCAHHPLRAYDAVQLASAVEARTADPELSAFGCFDRQLSAAARTEGLATLP